MAKRFANRTRVGIMTISCYSFWSMSNHLDGLLEKTLGRFHVPLLAQKRIDQIAIPIDGAVKIAPFPMHFEVRFIDVPRLPGLSSALGPQLVRQQRSKPRFPL